ncbi:MAG: hypothetical protein ACI89E_000615 [Planctomycetota bacterium]|jgi:hypothetical protein
MIRKFTLLLAVTLFSGCGAIGPVSDANGVLVSASPPVSTGLVEWHAGGFEAAKGASRVSGRPVLLFELFGKLDDAFC